MRIIGLNPRWNKVLRDLWSNKTRTVLVVLSIAVGVFAFASVFTTQDILLKDMMEQYRDSNVSAITYYVESADDGLVRWAKRQPEISDSQVRSIYSIKVDKQGTTHNMDLYVYSDFRNITVNRFVLEQGKAIPERREILLDRSSAKLLNASPGDYITLEMPDGRQYQVTVVGIVYDVNAVPANLFPQLSGYTTLDTASWLGFPAVYSRLEVVPNEEYDSLDKLEGLATVLKDRLERSGVEVGTFYNVRAPDEHWAKETTESFSLILTVIGIFSLVLSGFLVINTMSSQMVEQRRQIGMMKSIGGTPRQIAGIYLVLVAVYGILALVVAVPMGLYLSYVFIVAVTQFLNMDIIHFHLPLQVLAMQIAAALLVPIISAAIPLRTGIRVPVREAVSDFVQVKSTEHRGWLDLLILKVRWLPRPVLLSLRNTFRRKGRLLLTLGTLSLAGTLFISVTNVRSSLMYELDNLLYTVSDYEVSLYLAGSYPANGLEHRAEIVPGVIKAESRTSISAQYIKEDGSEGHSFSINGVNANTDFIHPALISGRWLTETDRKAMVISSSLAEDIPGITSGDQITLRINEDEQQWIIAGIYLNAFERSAYATMNYVASLRGISGDATALFIRILQKDTASQTEMAKVIETRLKDSGIAVGYSMTKATIVRSNASQFDFLISFLLSMAAMTALIGVLGLAGMMGISIMERTREIGVMRSIGATNAAIGSIVVVEGLIIGLISWILALPLSIPFSLGFNALLGQIIIDNPLTFIFEPSGPVIWLVIVVVISLIASLLPAYRAIRMSIRETLAYE